MTRTKNTPTPDERVSAALRAGTRRAHRVVERTVFLQAFLRGVVDRRAYARLLHALLHVYTALEEGLARCHAHPGLAALAAPGLARRAALRADLELHDPSGQVARAGVSPATRAYVERLAAVEREAPVLLAAHAYTRYLGDLSGGRVLRRLVARALELPDARGLAFYEFPALGDLAAFRDEYRRRLDALGSDPALIDALVAEANVAFAHNHALFLELEGSALRTVLSLLRGALRPLAATAARPQRGGRRAAAV
ncbi:MAG: biliverdin-producing heme oxygenase [Myxococcales bacterium]|nr:biliverdin-producing heme oxygenase [Myxococcales bacterium]